LLFLLVVLLLFVMTSISCPADKSKTFSSTRTSTNTFTQEQTHLTLSPDSTFFLQLKSNPSTGFSWSVHPSTDQSIKQSLSSSASDSVSFSACAFEKAHSPPGMVGAGGSELWEFKTGPSTGHTYRLAMQYARPWEGDKDQADAVWSIQVNDANAHRQGL